MTLLETALRAAAYFNAWPASSRFDKAVFLRALVHSVYETNVISETRWRR